MIQDTGRLQTSVPTSSDLVTILKLHISKLFGNYFQIFNPFYIMSEPGCEEQKLHRDYKRNSISRHPKLVITSLTDCHRPLAGALDLNLGGAPAYSQINIRLHTYLSNTR
ncbi:hypothetical protein BC833DRAFT_568160 [Globomyces pollinis-pini]|nr:hypothetical protein BC833DRAFT_568160 [Globomyces pollinis-pini]